jgi:hypothetical protein
MPFVISSASLVIIFRMIHEITAPEPPNFDGGLVLRIEHILVPWTLSGTRCGAQSPHILLPDPENRPKPKA